MDFALRVNRGETLRQLQGGGADAVRIRGAVGHEVESLDQLHREEALLVLDEQVVQLNQIVVARVGEGSELALEGQQRVRVDVLDRLQCDPMSPDEVFGFIHDAESTRADAPQYAESIGDGEVGVDVDQGGRTVL